MGDAVEEQYAPGLPGIGDGDGEGFSCRYLAAKKGIDDRALNRHVWDTLLRVLPHTTAGAAARILEIGAGIGTMVERAGERGLLTGAGLYRATDREIAHLRTAQHRLQHWAMARGDALLWHDHGQGVLRGSGGDMALVLERVSVEELAQQPKPSAPFHLLIAHALLDLVDFHQLLPGLFAQLSPHGLLLLTCNFDGDTVFLPADPGDEEREIIGRYHASMEQRLAGASQCGRRLLSFLQAQGLTIVAAGASDWVVHPQEGAGYAADDAFFLHAMVATVAHELAKKGPPPLALASWARTRHRQIEAGQLTFMARHLDLLARLGG
jgi:hypothetical protein